MILLLRGWEDEGEMILKEGNLEGSSGGKKTLVWPCFLGLLMVSRNANWTVSPWAIERNI